MTADMNPGHCDALTCEVNTLRRRLFHHASDPWEGDNATLNAGLVTLFQKWTDVSRDARVPCTILFTDDESMEFLRLERTQCEADEQFQACQEAIGVGHEGWVPVARHDEAKEF